MPINMIVAVNSANKIGYSNGDLPWHIPGDLKRFKELTMGRDVIMGFNTFKSIEGKFPGGFPGRNNHVLTSKPKESLAALTSKGVSVASDLGELCKYLNTKNANNTPSWICGGAQVYNKAIELNLVDKIYLTVVSCSTIADVELGFELAAWKLFIIRQANLGIQWEVSYLEEGLRENDIEFSYVTLTKLKE